MKRVIIGAMAIIATGFLWYSMSVHSDRAQQSDTGMIVVRTERAESVITNNHYTVGATVTAAQEVTLTALIGGTVTFNVHEGALIRKGQVVATVAAPEYGARLAQARAAAAQTEAVEAQARRHWDEFKPEVRRQYILASEQARAALREAQSYVAKTVVRAPFDARVLERYSESGATVLPGAAIVRIGRSDAREVRVAVMDAVAAQLKIGQDVTVRAGAQTVRGRIEFLAPAADAQTHKAMVTVALEDASALESGTFVTVTFDVAQSAVTLGGAVRIPSMAVLRTYDDYSVYVIAGGSTKVVSVDVVSIDGASAVVRGALREGDAVAVTQIQRLADGMAVDVLND